MFQLKNEFLSFSAINASLNPLNSIDKSVTDFHIPYPTSYVLVEVE
jgi:hypothetical protein